jgi:hypothetical protein
MRDPSPEREAYWRGMMARQVESGLNAAQFCQRENLSAPSFYLWKRKLRERDAGGGWSGHENDGRPASTRFVPVRIESHQADLLNSAIRIHWPSGVQLEIPLSAGRDIIDQLLRSLSQLAPLAQERGG